MGVEVARCGTGGGSQGSSAGVEAGGSRPTGRGGPRRGHPRGGGPGGEVVRGGGLGGALATHSEIIFIFESFLTVELVFITCCWMFI